MMMVVLMVAPTEVSRGAWMVAMLVALMVEKMAGLTVALMVEDMVVSKVALMVVSKVA